MKKFIAILIIFSIFFISCTTIPDTIPNEDSRIEFSCNLLQTDFDEWNSPTIIDCDNYKETNERRYVGGVVIETESKYVESYNRYEEHYVLKGINEQHKVYGISPSENITLQNNTFYSFDLMNLCGTMTSMASSGAINIQAFEEHNECKE